MQVPNESSKDFFKFGLLINKKFPKYISSSSKTINELLKNVPVWWIEIVKQEGALVYENIVFSSSCKLAIQIFNQKTVTVAK